MDGLSSLFRAFVKRDAYCCVTLVDYRGVPVKAMFAPIDDRVFFVGEHTTLDPYIVGTMEAAVESGRRIAELW